MQASMSKLLAPAALPLLLLIVLSACTTPAHGGDDYTAFVYAGCSQARYDPGSQYAADVDTTLSYLVNSDSYTAYGNYTSPSAATGLAVVYQCRSDLPAVVCGGCVKNATTKLSSLCNSAAARDLSLASAIAETSQAKTSARSFLYAAIMWQQFEGHE